jgi:glycine oxidase ThiO
LTRIVVIGCGVVGATIAYELSHVQGLSITVLDRTLPAQSSTGAALGVLMAVISQKLKGRIVDLRLASLQRYDRLIPDLQQQTGRLIPYNRQGLLKLCFTEDELAQGETLAAMRATQGWTLELLSPSQVQRLYPQISHPGLQGAVYSPNDRQVDPVALTQALVAAASQNGVKFDFHATVQPLECHHSRCQHVKTLQTTIAADWVVISAGLGSTSLTTNLTQALTMQPVLGQALRVKLEQQHNPDPQPVITGDDIHVVPLGAGNYWVGATVEFPAGTDVPEPDASNLDTILQQAISFYPTLSNAVILKTWYGLRPRPVGRPAPIVERLSGFDNIILATGHYRNGVLLAPATAQMVRDLILADHE